MASCRFRGDREDRKMTKEEYHRLLKSDYWKGFSYSIIKERNYTCEDCGAYYPQERNKLQVHHLVYRDINPWSYKPEEMVVLCEDCHKKRHGLYVYKPIDDSFKEKIHAILLNVWYKIKHSFKGIHFKRRSFRKLLFLILIFCIAFCYVKNIGLPKRESQENTEVDIDNNKDKTIKSPKSIKSRTTKEKVVEDENEIVNNEVDDEQASSEGDDFEVVEASVTTEPVEEQVMTKKEARKHAKAVKKALKEGVSTEGTTEEILERIKQAKIAKKAEKDSGNN